MASIHENRRFMRSNFAEPTGASDQQRRLPPPALQLPVPPEAEVVDLPPAAGAGLACGDIDACLRRRRSRREFSRRPVSLAELSYLLWATQGINEQAGPHASLRPVPSAGARHPFETYLAVRLVEGLAPGVWRYLPVSHQVARLFDEPNLPDRLARAALGQRFVGYCAVCFLWSCLPYRGEWRYHLHAHKPMLLDAGHVCQNLYLACEALGLGTCAVAAYDQDAVDAVCRLDGRDEFVVYLAPVGVPAAAPGP